MKQTQDTVDILKYDGESGSQYIDVESGDASMIVAKHETHVRNRLIVASIISVVTALFTVGIAIALSQLVYVVAGLGVAIGLLLRETLGGPNTPEIEANEIPHDTAQEKYDI